MRGKTPEVRATLTLALSRWRERGKEKAYIFVVRECRSIMPEVALAKGSPSV